MYPRVHEWDLDKEEIMKRMFHDLFVSSFPLGVTARLVKRKLILLMGPIGVRFGWINLILVHEVMKFDPF